MARDLLKRCDCPADRWSKCSHGWHVRKQVGGHRPKISLDELVGHVRIRLVSQAEAARDAVVGALRERPANAPLMPWLRAHPLVLALRDAADPVRLPAAALSVAADGVPLADIGARYVAALDTDPDRRPKYLANVRSQVALLTAWPLEAAHAGYAKGTPLGRLPVGRLSDDLLESFLLSLARGGRSVSTRNKYLDFLRRLGRWAKRKGYRADGWLVSGDDPHGPKRKKETRRRRRLEPGEGDRLLAVAGPLLRALIIAGVELGARLGELLRILWADVDLVGARVTVTDLKDPTRRRQLPLSARMLAVLEMRRLGPDGEPLERDAYVFGNEVGERVGSVYTAWQTAVLKAHGQPVLRDPDTHALLPASVAAYHAIDLVFSDLRHEATSGWLDTAVPMHTVRDWLGHTTFAMLSTYGHTTPQESARAMREFEAARSGATLGPVDGASAGPDGGPGDQAPGKVAQSGPTGAIVAQKRKGKKTDKSLVH